ncbi:MAG: right-handed parallel beta-helix repeat-containing protein [Candidatus Latescibacterota bacterium]
MKLVYAGRLLVVLALLITCATVQGYATTWLVKPNSTGDSETIQDAINEAAAGDTIYLADGVFAGEGNKNLDPNGKNLVIMPAPGASPIIDCQDSGRAFYIHNGEGSAMFIKGLCLTGGNPPGGTGSKGGAILIEDASPTVAENFIYENQAYFGAGMYADSSHSLILRNQFTDNAIKASSGYWGYGSAIHAAHSTLSIYDNRMLRTGFGFEEAVYLLSSSVTFENNELKGYGWVDGIGTIIADSSNVTILGNRIEDGSGCVWLNYSTGTIRSNYFLDCYHMAGNAGVQAWHSDVDIEFNYFDHVTDGVIDWFNSTGTIQRNVISGAEVRGLDCGARAVNISDGTQPDLMYNTFYENGTTDFAGCTSAADVHVDGVLVPVNQCIFVNSTALDLAIVCGPPPWRSSDNTPSQIYFNWHYGNTTESVLYFCNFIISVLAPPCLYDPDNDNFFFTGELPNDSTLMGALPPGYSTSDVLSATAPSDKNIGTSSAPASIVLSGFSFENLSNFSAPVNYHVVVEGPARLDDDWNPASLAGSTPLLDPGQTWVPPAARIVLDDPLAPALITVKYVTACAPALAIPETTRTTILIYDDATTVTPGQRFDGYALEQNFPNPANPSTTIVFSLADAGEVTLTLYDVRGRVVKTLASEPYSAGRHAVVWDGTDTGRQPVASGIYFYRIEAGRFTDTKKLLLLK